MENCAYVLCSGEVGERAHESCEQGLALDVAGFDDW